LSSGVSVGVWKDVLFLITAYSAAFCGLIMLAGVTVADLRMPNILSI
jgi:hypothetical protein